MYRESLLFHFHRAEALRADAVTLLSVDLKTRQLCDLELLLNRAFFPLNGFMGRADYERVLSEMRLSSGELWPLPVCLDVSSEIGQVLQVGDRLALRDHEGCLLAILNVTDVWLPDFRREASAVFGTVNPAAHPSVRTLLSNTDRYYVGGSLEGLSLPLHIDFQDIRRSPSEVYRSFLQSGQRKIIAYQCEQQLHRGYREMLFRGARENGASVLLHPIVAGQCCGDLNEQALVRSCLAFARQFPQSMISLGLLPLYPRKAGPREALLQALVHRNYGCTHFVVAHDQADPFAGTGSVFYPEQAAQYLVRNHENETGIALVPMCEMVYVEELAQYMPQDEVKAGIGVRTVTFRELRHSLDYGVGIPEWFSFSDVVEELRRVHPPRSKQGFTIATADNSLEGCL